MSLRNVRTVVISSQNITKHNNGRFKTVSISGKLVGFEDDNLEFMFTGGSLSVPGNHELPKPVLVQLEKILSAYVAGVLGTVELLVDMAPGVDSHCPNQKFEHSQK